MAKRKRAGTQDQDKASKQPKLKLDGSISKDEEATTSNVEHFTIDSAKAKDIICERRGRSGKPDLIWTHGAGGGLSNAATQEFADGFAEVSPVVSFQGTMNLQSRTRSFSTVLEHEDASCALGGRSMGARAAVVTAQQWNAEHSEAGVKAVVLVSYPLVGASKGDVRDQILLDLPENIDVLFISGSKDSMCKITQLEGVMEKMKARTWLVEVQGADHGMGMKPKAGTGPVRTQTGRIAAGWLADRDASQRRCSLSWRDADRRVVTEGWHS